MKKYLTVLPFLFFVLSASSQYDAFSFQALVVDANNNAIENSKVVVRATISKDIDLNDIYYQEEISLVTNAAGTIRYAIGTGEPIIGKMENADWLASVPYMTISYNRLDGQGWQEGYTKKFHSVPFCLESRYIVCKEGEEGPQGSLGPQGNIGPPAAIGSSPSGAQGPAGPTGVPILEPLNIPPTVATEGRVYFDDGTNSTDGNPRFRYYNGNDWIDLGI